MDDEDFSLSKTNLDSYEQWPMGSFKDTNDGKQTANNNCERVKEEQMLEKRNARERGRVRAVNSAFARLRLVVPSIAHRNKRVSKVKTLQKAIKYIMDLEYLLYIPLNSDCFYHHRYHHHELD